VSALRPLQVRHAAVRDSPEGHSRTPADIRLAGALPFAAQQRSHSPCGRAVNRATRARGSDLPLTDAGISPSSAPLATLGSAVSVRLRKEVAMATPSGQLREAVSPTRSACTFELVTVRRSKPVAPIECFDCGGTLTTGDGQGFVCTACSSRWRNRWIPCPWWEELIMRVLPRRHRWQCYPLNVHSRTTASMSSRSMHRFLAGRRLGRRPGIRFQPRCNGGVPCEPVISTQRKN